MQIRNKYGETVEFEVGTWVGFKSDIEQTGKVTKINGDWITLEDEDGFEGGYIGGQTKTQVHIDDIF